MDSPPSRLHRGLPHRLRGSAEEVRSEPSSEEEPSVRRSPFLGALPGVVAFLGWENHESTGWQEDEEQATQRMRERCIILISFVESLYQKLTTRPHKRRDLQDDTEEELNRQRAAAFMVGHFHVPKSRLVQLGLPSGAGRASVALAFHGSARAEENGRFVASDG